MRGNYNNIYYFGYGEKKEEKKVKDEKLKKFCRVD